MIIVTAFLLLIPYQGFAEVRMDVLGNISLDEAHLDTAVSDDGKRMYVLFRGIIRIYSVVNGQLMESIAVDDAVDRIDGVTRDNLLLLGSTGRKQIQIVQLNFIRGFSTEDSPQRGSENAPIVITVFNDFQ